MNAAQLQDLRNAIDPAEAVDVAIASLIVMRGVHEWDSETIDEVSQEHGRILSQLVERGLAPADECAEVKFWSGQPCEHG